MNAPPDPRACLTPATGLIAAARAGQMFVLVDDEDRENEGDLVIPAEYASAAAINFMARHARGLICLALTADRVRHLGLPPMSQANGTRHETAFTVSIEARDGVTTGISAQDRARTIAAAIDPANTRDAIVTPGHVFPLAARDGGTLIRAGHTEAAVDIARLAGLNPAGVICEIMNDDGTMARLPQLLAFAGLHELKIGSIADLIRHRRRTETLVRRVAETPFVDADGHEWRMIVYATTIDYSEHVALVRGDVSCADEAAGEPALVRMHPVDVMDNLMLGPRWQVFHGAMRMINAAGRGVVVILRESRPTLVSDRVRAHLAGMRPAEEIRDNGVGAQILADLGVRRLVLLSNSRHHVVALDGYGIEMVEQRAVDPRPLLGAA